MVIIDILFGLDPNDEDAELLKQPSTLPTDEDDNAGDGGGVPTFPKQRDTLRKITASYSGVLIGTHGARNSQRIWTTTSSYCDKTQKIKTIKKNCFFKNKT